MPSSKTPTKPRKTTTTRATSGAKPKTAVRKSTVTKSTRAKPKTTKAPKAAPAPAAKVVAETKPVVSGPVLKKPELIDRVVAETGMKKKDVKPVVEAMLNVLGLGLAKGEEMNLPPLGKVMINRTKDLAKAKVIVTKVRQPKAAAPEEKDPLAEAAE
ncbi:HU family DNA-binding protein [Salibaculum griseiflavum]|uniref:DNA-binding protein n=1 Tax=Salibaculum griseiflavum TaxID=1914409 RepID=A0A2V1P8H9_9RHOB|nr:HU family DNA-binding protein [Salibaculum griseiflavum]PWG18134.1 DNA-binding protein [Salibaculum griseiflavum]